MNKKYQYSITRNKPKSLISSVKTKISQSSNSKSEDIIFQID